MNGDHRTLWSAAWPTLSVGCPVAALTAWLSDGVMTPLCVLITAVLGAGLTAYLVHQAQQETTARLRHPELPAGRWSGGMLREVARTAVELIQQQEQETERASSAKAELEIAVKLQKRQARRLEAALKAIDDAVLICDSRDEVLFANAAARHLPLFADQSVRDSGMTAKTQPLRMAALAQLIRETRLRSAASVRRMAEFDASLRETPVPFRAVVTALIGDQGEVLGTIAVLTDICEERSAKSRHAEFVSSVAHEFKTPMASIKAFLELLIDGDVEEPEQQRQLFQRIDSQVDRLNRLVSNLLNLARIESGALKVQREDGDLNDVLNKAAEVVRPLAEERGQSFIVELSPLYLPVHADCDLLGQAIINLLSNAVKYTPSGGRITLRSTMDEIEATIVVEDTGYGIPPESLPKIFERFYRVPEHTQAAAGTGLGLAFVQSIVQDLHNGHVNVVSTVNVGSTFSARIPLGHHDAKRNKRLETSLTNA